MRRFALALSLIACYFAGADIVLFDAATADRAALSAQDGATFVLTNGLLTVTTKPRSPRSADAPRQEHLQHERRIVR